MFYFMLGIVIFAVVFLVVNYFAVVKQLRKADEAKTISIDEVKSKKE